MEKTLAVIQLTPEKLGEIVEASVYLGAHKALLDAGLPVKEYFTRTELSRRHGKGRVDRIIDKLTPYQYVDDGECKPRIVYSETELLTKLIV